ncbi:Uncharacterised protein [Serratia entomophila]|uniref:hypothetical protein n=1 Tax=Serratia entomophila TaxID=42906 RepID=UPI0021778652|nr:hypothetical protein [Serratia entomophila]CAI1574023.1 Uncharacterised protein [Serratia entomophila]
MTRGPTLEGLRTHGAFMLSELKRNHGGFFSGVTMTQTLTTERLKALLDELKSWQYGYDPVDDKEQFDMLATAEWAVIELLANREAQPVQVTDGMALAFHRALTDGDIGKDDLEEIKVGLRAALCNVTSPLAPAGEVVVTRNERGDIVAVTRQDCEGRVIEVIAESNAPPAPAVPEEMTGGIAMSKYKVKKSNYVQWVKGFNSCRAAMLAQPVSSGYTLPEGWKLVPVEPTAEMINAALASGALSIRTAYRVMLAAAPEQNKPADHAWVKCAACGHTTHQHFDHCGVHCGEVMAAAPEGGNDHDTRR